MKRRKNKKAETFTVTAKRFMISCILILSMTGFAAGISYAGGNSRHMAMGESGSTVALAHNEKKLELNINEKTAVTFNLSLPEKYRDYLYFLPAPEFSGSSGSYLDGKLLRLGAVGSHESCVIHMIDNLAGLRADGLFEILDPRIINRHI